MGIRAEGSRQTGDWTREGSLQGADVESEDGEDCGSCRLRRRRVVELKKEWVSGAEEDGCWGRETLEEKIQF